MQAFLGIPDLDRPAAGSVAVVPLWVDQLQRFVPRALTGATLSGFTVNQVPVGTSTGALAGTSALTFNGTTFAVSGGVSATSLTDSGLTSGRVTFASTAGLLADSANLTYGSGKLTIADGTASTSTSSGALVISNTGGLGVSGAAWIGTTFNVAGASTLQSTLDAAGVVTITNATAATSITVGGALVLTAAGIRVATGSSFFGGALAIERAAAGNAVFTGKVTGDAQNRVQMVVSGTFSWGDGTNPVDTNIFRDAADTLKTNDSFIVSLGFGLGVTSTATAAGTTTLVVGSTAVQTFTGSTTQIVQFPAANARGAGIAILYIINNQSSGALTPTRAGSDTFQGGGTTDTVAAGATSRYLSDGVSVWLKV